MEMLQICSYYIGNKLYQKLFTEFSSSKIVQHVYIPVKNQKLVNQNYFAANQIKFYYDSILKKYDRYFYKGKINKQKRRIELKIPDINNIKLIHAHTLFSDGGTAYRLHKKYGIPYIVSIRNTDINVFYKYAIQHRAFAHKVLANASAIIFISPAYRDKTLNILPRNLKNSIKGKLRIIPNGIDENWLKLNSFKTDESKNLNSIQLLFTGSLDKNKNLHTVLDLVADISRKGREIYLNVAGDGSLMEELISYSHKIGIEKKVNFHGKVSMPNLIKLMDQSTIFILPSYKETFGISYIEAMSRGVPIVYTRNEGIDGYFPEGRVGFSTDPKDLNEMRINIDKIINNYERISKTCIEEAMNFKWKDIAKEYIDLYNEIKN